MAVTQTILSIPSQDQSFQIPGDWSAAQVRSMYAAQLPYLANMVDSTSTAAGADGDVKTITFTQRTGNKG